MEDFSEFLKRIENQEHRARTEKIFNWVMEKFPTLKPEMKWNQPMFTDHGTYIIGFSVAKQHLSVAPEQAGMNQFIEEIVQAGYDYTKELMRIKWNRPVDFLLLEKMIAFNMMDKADCSTFWR